MIQLQQAAKHLFASGWADGVADPVVFSQGLHFVEVVVEGQVLPALGIPDGEVELDMQPAQFQQSLIAAYGFGSGFLADLSNHRRRQSAGMEEVVDVCKAKPEGEHQGLAVLMVTLPN